MFHALGKFLGDENISFYRAAAVNDVSMLAYYGTFIPWAHDLQRVIANLTANYSHALYPVSNVDFWTNLLNKGFNFIGCDRWSNHPLSIDKTMFSHPAISDSG
jgi:hypothetical protein